MKTISFIAQVDNEADKDSCRYVLATVDADLLSTRLRGLEVLRRADPGMRALLFDDGIVKAHFVDPGFPVSEDGLEEGQSCPLSEPEQLSLDAEGWSPVSPSVVSGVPESYSGFEDMVEDSRLVVSELGLSLWASRDDGVVRSWTVGWQILDSAREAA